MKRLLSWLLGPRGDEALGDLDELFGRRVQTRGLGSARLRLALDVVSLLSLGCTQRSRHMLHALARLPHALLVGLVDDLRYSVRLLRKSPTFSLSAVLILALGIGANTTVFSLVNAVLLTPTAAEQSRVIGLYARSTASPGRYRTFSYDDYRTLRTISGPFDDVMAFTFARVGLTEGGDTRHMSAVVATANYFSILSSPPILGRDFTADEETPGADARVAIVSYDFWRRHGQTAAILGHALRLNGVDFTVVGVAPEGFTGTLAVISPEVWLPTGAVEHVAREQGPAHEDRVAAARAARRFSVVARVPAGLDESRVQPILATLTDHYQRTDLGANGEYALMTQALPRMTISAQPASNQGPAAVSALLMSTTGLVLLLACLNLANMLLARAAGRRREIAMRTAIGASRLRIIRQLLVESSLLALVGGTVGCFLAIAATGWLADSARRVLPLSLTFDGRPDARVLAATLGFCMISTLVAGLWPAWRASRANVVEDLKRMTGSFARSRRFSMQGLLVTAQLAVCLTLLVSAGLFVRGARAAVDASPGFATDRGIVVRTDPGLVGFSESDGRRLLGELLQRLRALPGVDAVSVASIVPFGDERDMRGVRLPAASADQNPLRSTYTIVGTDYFKALGLPVTSGREFSPAEESSADGRSVAIIDRPLARQIFGDTDPVGRSIVVTNQNQPDTEVEVIGVVPGVRDSVGDEGTAPHLYVPIGQRFVNRFHFHVRATPGTEPRTLLGAARLTLTSVDSSLPVLTLATYDAFRTEGLSVWATTTLAALFAVFGIVAMTLAITGVYGLRAYVVAGRTREVGIRLALGATPTGVRWMIVREGAVLTIAGLGIGLLAAWAFAQVLRSLLSGVSPTDPLVFVGSLLTLALASLAASYVPARRGTRMGPAIALRAD